MTKSFPMRLLSVLLTLALVFTLTEPAAGRNGLSSSVKAEEISGSLYEDGSEEDVFPGEEDLVLSPEVIEKEVNEPIPSVFDSKPLELKDSAIRDELPEKRDEYEKQFLLTDGSIGYVSYNYPINEKDPSGQWQEIDNRLVSEKDPNGYSVYTREGLYDRVKFCETLCKGSLYTVETESGSISWGITGSNEETTAEFIPVSIPEGYSLLVPKSAGDHVRYPNILPHIHADYRLIGHTLKEDIVLENEEAINCFLTSEGTEPGLSFTLSLEGYTAVLKDEQTISILDSSSEAVYELTAPLMTDSEGEYSKDITLTIVPGEEENSYTVYLLPDMEWLSSEERAFPITIDPSLIYLIGGAGAFSCSTCYSSNPNAYVATEMAVGREGSYQNCRAVFKVNNLPSLTEAETVIDARIGFIAVSYSALGASHLGPVSIGLYPLTDSVDVAHMTWNNLQGHYSTIASDSETITEQYQINTLRPRVTWDVTKTVKDWYLTGHNYGMVMISENESSSSVRYVRLNNGMYSTDEALLPTFQITYLNQEGFEDYLTCHSFGSGTMGTLSVGDFNGNLIYTYNDLSMTGQYLPVSISHVYNASQKKNNDPSNSGSMYFGKGMRLNLSLRIESSTVTGYPYKLTDADGTVHYFSLKSGTSGATGSTYKKEFESSTILTKTSSGYTLNPKGGDLTYTFNSSGFLTKITDITTGKSQTLTYSSGKLTKVTDGGGRITTFSYNSSNYLTSITDPSGRSTTYSYDSNNCLTTITRPDGKTVSLTYVSKGGGRLISKVTDIDGTSIAVTYYDSAPYRVKTLLEYASNGSTQGRKLTFTYNAGETTVKDRNNRSETMLFDYSGHTVSIRDNLGNAVTGNYNNTNDDKKHGLLYASSMQGTVTNYLKNHDFENNLTNWSVFASSGNTAGSLSADTSTVREGTKSLKLESTGNTATYGTYQTITIPGVKGKTLTLSAYVYFDAYTPTSSYGFRLNIRYKDASGNWTNHYSPVVLSASGWVRTSWTVTVPDTASSEQIQVALAFWKSIAACYIDSVQLEEGAVSNRYNYLENGHFRDDTNTTVPSSWTGTGLESTDKVVTDGHATYGSDTTNGYQITGNSQTEKYVYQTVPVKNGKTGDSWVFGAWARADSIAKTGLYHNDDRPFAVRIRFIKSDNTYTEQYFGFEAKTPGWQYLSGTYVAPHNYVSVQFALTYSKQKNEVTFDDANLFRERYGDRYTYDSEGRVTQVISQAGLTTSYTYLTSGRPEISKVTYPDGTQTTYSYNTTNRRLLSVTDSSGKTVSYTYDSNGNQTKAETTSDGKTLTSNVSTYSGNYLSSLTDPFGDTTNYTYNNSKGTLTSLTNAKSVTTNYTYNAQNDLLTKVKTDTSEVNYGYNTGNRLISLSHNTSSSSSDNVNYSFQYNTFGTQTGIKVGSQSLVSYTYAANNGDLTKTAYGNGQYEEPEYDALGRISALSYNGVKTYEYYYGTNGKAGLVKDLTEGIYWRYEYDQAGRVTCITSSEGERHTYKYSSATGELTSSSFRDITGTTNAGTTYTYGNYNGTTGERLLEKITIHAGRLIVDYDYDGFYRQGKTLELNTGYSLGTTYEYRTGTGTNTTSLLPKKQTETLKDPNGNTLETTVLNYTYDSLGNIETVKEGSTEQLRYHYDSLNQLTREDNAYLNKTIVYSYDLGGNLQEAKEYAYQTGDTLTGTGTTIKSYTYGDSNWKDRLTSYNGNAITYDAIGNPLSYYNGFTFTWQKGRQLGSATNGTDTITYGYNPDGYRTSKTVNGVTTKYTLEGSLVKFEKTGSTNTWYYYDASGAPVGMAAGASNLYLYRKNLQGDITGIYSGSTGTLLVSYVYDAWGKPTITDEAGTTESANLITRNPYLYRGYRYDHETGLYYLNSRYYDSETGRFVNADVYASTGDSSIACNMFAYCLNNPVNLIDAEGTWPNLSSVFLGIAIAAAAVAFVALCVVTCGGAAAVGGGVAAAVAVSSTTMVAAQVTVAAAGVAAVASDMAIKTYVAEEVVKAVSISYSSSKSKKSAGKKPTATNQLREQVRKRQAPKDVVAIDDRFEGNPDGQAHIHLRDGTVLNLDGTRSHKHKGKFQVPNEVKDWLRNQGHGERLQ